MSFHSTYSQSFEFSDSVSYAAIDPTLTATIAPSSPLELPQHHSLGRRTSSSMAPGILGWSDALEAIMATDSMVVPTSIVDIGVLNNVITYNGAINNTNTSDIYQFTLTQSKDVNLWLSGLSADADLKLYGDFNGNGTIDAGEEIKRSDFGGASDDFINVSGLADGRYFVEVYQYQGITPYTLRLSSSDISELLPTEVNVGNLNSTYSITGNLNDKNTADVYRFNLATVSNFNLSLTGLSADADIRLIRDLNNNGIVDTGEEVARSQRGSSLDESLNLANLSAGIYFLQVYQYSGNTAYTLNLSPNLFSNLLPTETNVGTLTSTTQTFGNFVGNTDTADTYRFNLNTAATLNLNLTGLSADADVQLIQDVNNNGIIDTGEVIASSIQGGSNPETITRSLQAGQYWVQVYQYAGQTNYTLSLNATPSLTTDNAGNTLATARNIGTLSTLQTFNDYVGSDDTNDFYRFSLGATSSVTLNLNGLSADADMQLIRDTNNNGVVDTDEVLAYPWQDGTTPESLTIALDAGSYFIRVFPYIGNTNYTLTAAASAIVLPPGYNPNYGYGMVDAAATVATALNQSPFAPVANLGGNNWGLDMVNAPEVWAQGYTGQNIIVAVVDSGVDYIHPDLDANIWVNSDEIAGNGVDDDGNGFIDDIRGWDFVSNDNDPMDLNGHGTHVAGTIAAENNGVGVTGVAYNATIMPVQVLSASGSGSWSGVANGIRYAATNGADVINLSLGGGYSADVAAAIQYAQSLGSVVVMASGNESSFQPGFPANLATQFGIAVGAVNSNRQLASFSNDAGITPVEYVVAPGVNVYSTVPNNGYQSYSGTSMATPHVAGVVALLLSANPSLTPQQVISLLTDTAEPDGITA